VSWIFLAVNGEPTLFWKYLPRDPKKKNPEKTFSNVRKTFGNQRRFAVHRQKIQGGITPKLM
jgi:hypothetical protein